MKKMKKGMGERKSIRTLENWCCRSGRNWCCRYGRNRYCRRGGRSGCRHHCVYYNLRPFM